MPASALNQRPTLRLLDHRPLPEHNNIRHIAHILGLSGGPRQMANRLPFSRGDATAGVENEFQAVVIGDRSASDLPLTITDSRYYRNMKRKTAAGDTPRSLVSALDAFLEHNPDNIWENSWVRFPREALSGSALKVFNHDMLADKSRQRGPLRADSCRFQLTLNGTAHLRIPISYLMKLAMADALDPAHTPALVRDTGLRMLPHFLNDNTSPETTSFYPVCTDHDRHGCHPVAAETAKRCLHSQLLTQYANRKFKLLEHGQQAMVYLSPLPPQRQKQLNELVSDAFYRELFMSPCLSGWDRGEEKHEYMALCHKVLSRSQLNAISRLKEAGIITNNLVVLPNTSNTCLANNGTHLSLGSKRLSRHLDKNSGSEMTQADEKVMGDMVLKILEHFLPLFVGMYSGAPYRMAFNDFHPENALGFLPHELAPTHLRMIWRRWKKKADLNVMGRPLTPFGPTWLDHVVGRVFRLKGDLINDFRIIDYLVALLSTEESPAMNGVIGNEARLKADLQSMGIFDSRMPMYLLFRQRQHHIMGFSGFEGRHYSVFHSFTGDMGPAADLQQFVTALAYQYVFSRDATHLIIPDSPAIESERRQMCFAAAIGLPTFYVHRDSRNRFLRRILEKTPGTRFSRRYPGYIRVLMSGYQQALLDMLRADGAALIEAMTMAPVLEDLENRLKERVPSATAKLVAGILDVAGEKSAMSMRATDFNAAAEKYYREHLRNAHMREALDLLRENCRRFDDWSVWREGYYNPTLLQMLDGKSATDYLNYHQRDILAGNADTDTLTLLIHLMVLSFHDDRRRHAETGDTPP